VSRYVFAFTFLLALPRIACGADHQAFLRQHCLDCHGPDLQEAGFRVDRLPQDLSDSAALGRWIRLFDRVRQGEMPPQDAEQPGEGQREQFVASLRAHLIRADRARIAQEGADSVRRMNRVEYENTMRDLLTLPLLRVAEMLPEDGQQHGFDKVPSALQLSHIQMSKYLQAADKALRQALVRPVEPPQTVKWRQPAADQWSGRAAIATHNAAPLLDGKLAPGLKTIVRGHPVEDPGNTYRAATFKGDADSLVVFSSRLGAHQPQGIQPDRFKPNVGGFYRVRFSIWSLRWERDRVRPAVRSKIRKYIEFGEPWVEDDQQRFRGRKLEQERVQEFDENVEFYGDAEAVHVVRVSLKGKVLGFFDAPSLEPTTHELKVWLEPGEKLAFHVVSLPANGPRNSASSNGVRSYEGPGVAFDWFEIEGPMVDRWPPESQQRLFGTTPISAFPRPLVKGLPTVTAGKAVDVPVDSLQGAGQHVGERWYLNVAGKAATRVNLASPGTYELAVTASQTPAGDAAAEMQLLVDGQPLPHGRFTVDAPRQKPETYRKSFAVDSAGPAEVGVEFLNDLFDEKTKADRNLLIEAMRLTGPEPGQNTEEAPEVPEVPEVRSLLRAFADRAFRRPVEAAEMDPFVDLIEAQLEQGRSFEEAMLAGYKALLCAPEFLFLGVEDPGPGDGQFTLASRLSYFLWNSMPDARLRELAGSGKLAQPEVLRQQVDRMLRDPRSDRFVEHFLDQWLELKDIDFTTPDPQLYPEFDRWLRDSMLAETRAYFRKLIAEDRGVSYLIDSDSMLINQRLAELYNVRGVAGGQLREVPIPADSLRGGLLTQAAVMKVTANGTATSPVLRGVWVTERILGVPVPPPPPNIPAVEPDATGAVTIREQIEMHRADPVCASCHKVMDPPGLALESFDVIGGYRERYRASGRPQRVRVPGQKGKVLEPSITVISSSGRRQRLRLGGEVDPSGELPDGREFADIDGLRNLLLEDEAALARNLVRQFAVYATGHGYRFSDRAEIEAIVAAAAESNYSVRSLIEGVVLSRLFTSIQ